MTSLAPPAPLGQVPDRGRGKFAAALRIVTGRPLVLVFAAAPLAVVLLLLGVIIYVSFLDNLNEGLRGTLTLRHFQSLAGDPLIYSALWNTAGFTLVTVITAKVKARKAGSIVQQDIIIEPAVKRDAGESGGVVLKRVDAVASVKKDP